jgi:hypothetical protein
MNEIDYLVIKLTSGDGNGVPVGLTQEPPMLYLTLKAKYPTVKFSDIPNPAETEPYWYGVFEWTDDPTHNQIFTKDNYTKSYRSDGVTKHADGVWRRTWTEISATPEEIAQRTENENQRLLKQRNVALLKSDFSQGVDAPDYVKAKQSEWNAYRQALRDLTNQTGFPWNVTFPTKPSK